MCSSFYSICLCFSSTSKQTLFPPVWSARLKWGPLQELQISEPVRASCCMLNPELLLEGCNLQALPLRALITAAWHKEQCPRHCKNPTYTQGICNRQVEGNTVMLRMPTHQQPCLARLVQQLHKGLSGKWSPITKVHIIHLTIAANEMRVSEDLYSS